MEIENKEVVLCNGFLLVSVGKEIRQIVGFLRFIVLEHELSITNLKRILCFSEFSLIHEGPLILFLLFLFQIELEFSKKQVYLVF
jgi:hypothetical protein